MQLAIDTSTDTASLALTKNNEILAELTWRCGQNHTTTLLPNLTALLAQIGAGTRDIKAIIVARGPGSYNGLRVGISTAKGLALSLGVPLVGINTLEAAAYPHTTTGFPVCPIFNAGRGEIATALYQLKDESLRQILIEQITTLEDLCQRLEAETVFCGELTPPIIEQLRKRLEQKAIIASPAARLRRAGYLAELGLKQLAAGNLDDPATLHPIYLRRPNITRPRKNNMTMGR